MAEVYDRRTPKTAIRGQRWCSFIKIIMGYDPRSSVLIVGMPSSGKSKFLPATSSVCICSYESLCSETWL